MSLPPMIFQSPSSLARSAATALRIQDAVLEIRQTTQELHRLNMCMWGMRIRLQREGLDLATGTFPRDMDVGDMRERGLEILRLVERDVRDCTFLLHRMHMRWRRMQWLEEIRVEFERHSFEVFTRQRQPQDEGRRIQEVYPHD